MRRLLKKALRAAYRRTEFVRRPIRAELEANFRTCIAGSFDEVRVAMEDLVAEVYRLQSQVADLKSEISGLRDDRTAA